MSVVVDASIVTKWLTPEDGTLTAVALLHFGERLHAPDLVYAEVANALCKKERQGDVTRAVVQEALTALTALETETYASKSIVLAAVTLASETKLTVYHCLNLVLARQLNASLATADKDLARAARRQRHGAVPVWGT